jgi:spermidine/putrescine transport system permease protein
MTHYAASPLPEGGFRLGRLLFGIAAWLPVLFFVLLPILGLSAFSFWVKEGQDFLPALSLINYERWFADDVYRRVFFITIGLALVVTLLDLLIAYPIAWFIMTRRPSMRGLLLSLVVAPLFMSYIIKLYAMRSLMGSTGYIAQGLEALGLNVPLSWLLFSQTSIFITMTIIYLPFVVLPIYATLSRMPRNLADASADLGARPGQTFWRVTFPLSLPGASVGAIFVFVLAVGDFVTPQMMGGTRGFTYGKLVWSQFGMAFEWPFGAAMGVMLLLVSLVAIGLAIVIGRKGAVSL